MTPVKTLLTAMLYMTDGTFMDGHSYPGFSPVEYGTRRECLERVEFLKQVQPPEGVKHIVFGCRYAPMDWDLHLSR
ncbi:MAG: hypothetical protein H6888_14235 [Nitratireductor sp.]|nr:hypothetical protein [Nitratireductor sp.]MCC0022223.1 hypothetical protein [Nitratireductor sp.]